MVASRLSPHPAGMGQRVRGVLGLAPRGIGARFAADEPTQPQSAPAPEPQPAAAAPQESPHPAHHHPVHKPHRNNMPLIFVLATVGAIVAFIVGMVVMRSMKMPFNELQSKLEHKAPDGRAAATPLSRDEFQQVVKVDPDSSDKDSVYFYQPVRGGTAQVVVDRASWENLQVRIKSVTLLPR